VKDCNTTEDNGDDVDGAGKSLSMRECPVPKPGGLMGDILGFKMPSSSDGKGSKPP
jgi:cytochrome c oxidase assembly factor 2